MNTLCSFLNVNFLNQFLPNFFATMIGVVTGAYISYLLINYQLKQQSKSLYTSQLKVLFSELQENERVLRQSDFFLLNLNDKSYKLLLGFLSHTTLNGALSSERLSALCNHKLIASLVLLQRKIDLHNQIVTQLFNIILNRDIRVETFEWLYTNLQEKQKILQSDFLSLMPVVKNEIDTVDKKGFNNYAK